MKVRTLQQFIDDSYGVHSAATTLFCKDYNIKRPTAYRKLQNGNHIVITENGEDKLYSLDQELIKSTSQ